MFKKLLALEWFIGHRTQLAAGAIALLTLLLNLKLITPEQYSALMGFLTAIGLVTASVHQTKSP